MGRKTRSGEFPSLRLALSLSLTILHVFRYDCSFRKKAGCKATASVEISYSEADNGDLVRDVKLKSCSTPEVHALFHEPERSSIIVTDIMTKMKTVVEGDINCKVGE